METKDVSGKAVVFQSGGPTRVINASLDGVCGRISTYLTEELSAQNHPKITSLYGARYGIEGILKEDFLKLVDEAGDNKSEEGLAHTPGAALGTTRYELYKKDKDDKTKPIEIRERACKRAIEVFKEHGIHYVFGIGGNDTAETSLLLGRAAEQENYPLKLIHIPKTIDNDLRETDHSPGYGSAARFLVSCVGGTAVDLRSTKKTIDVTVAMGRNAGWLTASASLVERLGIDPPLIFVPENPMEISEFIEAVSEEHKRENCCQVVVSEGMKTQDGKEWGKLLAEKYMPSEDAEKRKLDTDITGRPVLSSVPLAFFLEAELKRTIKNARFTPNQLGYIQRCSLDIHCETDFNEAREAGRQAVNYALEGKNCVMVALKRCTGEDYSIRFEAIPLDRVAEPGKKLIQALPIGYIDARTNRATELFLDYAAPLADIETMSPAVRFAKDLVDKKLQGYELEK